MQGKINCKYNDRGAWCTHRGIKRSLFGIGARCCVLYPPLNGGECSYQREHPRPPAPRPQRSPIDDLVS